MNGDGTPDYGSCIAKKRNAQTYWSITDVAGASSRRKGTSQGAFFDTEDMKPLINNEAFRKALEIYKETDQVRPAGRDQPRRRRHPRLFTSGRCALNLDWGDIGTLAIDPTTSKVHGQGRRGDHAGLARRCWTAPPASWCLRRQDLPLCDRRRQPRALRGLRRLVAAAINAKARTQGEGRGLRLLLLHERSRRKSNVDVTIGTTGFNPYRTSQFDNWTCGRRPA